MKLMQKAIENLSKLNTGKDYQQGIKAIIAHLCKKDAVNLFKNILTYQLIHMKSKVDLNKINQPNDRKEIINSIIDSDIKEIFNKLNENISNKNLTEFMNLLTSSTKDLAISLAPFDKKKEKNLNEKYYSEFSKNLDEKKNLVYNGFKKDFVNFVIDFGLLKLLNKNYFMKLPYENWVISVFSNLFDEKSLDGDLFKAFLTSTSKYVSMSDDDFSDNFNDVNKHLQKLIE
jgi:transcriptional regulator of heat shock response